MFSCCRFFSNLRKEAWTRLGLPVPNMAAAMHRVSINEAGLRASYVGSPLALRPDSFVLYRIIGNDLPPHHGGGRSLAHLRFILENEPPFPGCNKRWVVNRITDPEQEEVILNLLHQHNQAVLRIPFVAADYARIGLDFTCLPTPDFLASRRFARLGHEKKSRMLAAVHRLKNNYVMNINGARNAALADGRSRAKWILPFDGNCFFTSAAWELLVADVTARPWLKYFAVPMARLTDNQHLFDPSFSPPVKEEPQLLFRHDAAESFNPAFFHGRRPKVELFWRLGIPGPWDLWPESSLDQPRRPLSPEAYQFGTAGWIAGLSSGAPQPETGTGRSPDPRETARQEAILALLHSLDRAHGDHPSSSPLVTAESV